MPVPRMYLLDWPQSPEPDYRGNSLLTLPEDGLGYQFVIVTTIPEEFDNPQVPSGIYCVFNSELFVEIHPEFELWAKRKFWSEFSSWTFTRRGGHEFPWDRTFGVIDYEELTRRVRRDGGVHSLGKVDTLFPDRALPRHFLIAPVPRPLPAIRFSASGIDRRIAADGSVAPDTYATTIKDAGYVNSGFSTVARYALPNPFPANYASQIAASHSSGTTVGTVAPAFGESGGGVELLFRAGLPAGSATQPLFHHDAL